MRDRTADVAEASTGRLREYAKRTIRESRREPWSQGLDASSKSDNVGP
jgi:hypothetical protein